MEHSNNENIENIINLGIKFSTNNEGGGEDFLDELVDMLIKNSYKNTDQINILLEYIEHFADPKKLFSQYGQDVELGQIRHNLLKSYNKLDLYLTLVYSGVKVCS